MRRAGVSRDLHPEPPLPSNADFSARVFDQAWAAQSMRNSVTAFAVLALDEAHARELGERKIEAIFGDGALAEMRLLSSVPRTWSDPEALIALLGAESHADWEERQRRFAAKEAAHA